MLIGSLLMFSIAFWCLFKLLRAFLKFMLLFVTFQCVLVLFDVVNCFLMFFETVA